MNATCILIQALYQGFNDNSRLRLRYFQPKPFLFQLNKAEIAKVTALKNYGCDRADAISLSVKGFIFRDCSQRLLSSMS